MVLLAILPLVSLLLGGALIARSTPCWRTAALETTIAFGLALAFITEGLSAFRLLTLAGVVSAWTAVATLLCFALVRWKPKEPPAPRARRPILDQVERPVRLVLYGAVLVIVAVGVVAVLAAPSTWDSMAYHLVRVAHWVQNRSVRHFPTCYLPQIVHPPLAEFAILHLQLLTGGDRLANLVQWLSMLGSLLGVSLVARELGADPRGQVFAAIVAATLPMGLVQASSTQNDWVASLWTTSLAFFSLRAIAPRPGTGGRGIPWPEVWGAGGALALAIFTKGTSYLYAAPFVVALVAAVGVRRIGWSAWRPAVAIVALVVLVNGAHYARNLRVFGSPLSGRSEGYANQIHTPAAFASNIVRNLTLHLGTPFPSVNSRIDRGVRALHAALGIGVDDERTTAWGGFTVHPLNTFEDSAGNPLHLLLGLAAIGWYAAGGWRRTSKLVAAYLAILSAGAALFCFALKWQPWHSRLQLPLFVLSSAFVGLALSKLRARRAATATVALLVLASLPWVLYNQTRRVVPAISNPRAYPTIFASRVDQYFSAHPSARRLEGPYREAAAYLRQRGVRTLGLALPFDPWEYPLWVLLRGDGGAMRLEHVAVSNASTAAEPEPEAGDPPRAVLRVREDGEPLRPELRLGDTVYALRWTLGQVDVLERTDPR